MRKNLIAAIAVLIILSSVLVPFGKKAYAISALHVFHVTNVLYDTPNQLGDTLINSDGATIASQPQVFEDGAKLNVTIGIHGDDGVTPKPAHDAQVTGPLFGVVDWLDLVNTDWDSIMDDPGQGGTVGTDTKEGIFLQIGTTLDSISPATYIDGTTRNEISGDVAYGVVAPNGLQLPTRSSYGPGSGKAKQIEQLLWSNPTFFFDKNTFSTSIVVNGLQASTTYYARVIISESVLGVTDDYLGKDVIKFTTNATGTGTVGASGITSSPPATPPAQSSSGSDLGGLYCAKPVLDISVTGCFVELFNGIFVVTSAWLAETTGRLFDAFAAVSLGSTIYGGQAGTNGIASFINSGWSTVRDIANVFFIFLLLYTALSLVLSLHGFDAKKMIAKIIIVALLINFSLFFCHVAIDASNILSRVFYNAMSISSQGNDPTTTIAGLKEQSISAAVISGVQPQQIFSSSTFTSLQTDGHPSVGLIFIVLLMSFIINLTFAWMFFMCAAFFAGRIGVLWISMIFAPLAFVTSIVPELDSKFEQLGWSKWLSSFIGACFRAPIFFFLMYLIVNLVHGVNGGAGLADVVKAIMTPGTTFVMFMVGLLLPMLILIGLIREAKNIAEKMAGEFGGAFTAMLAAGVGIAAVAATGGAALAGRGASGIVSLAGNNAAQKDLAEKNKNLGAQAKAKSFFNPTKYTDYAKVGMGKAKLGAAQSGVAKDLHDYRAKAAVKQTGITTSKALLEEHATSVFHGTEHEGKKYSELDTPQREQVHQSIDRDKVAQDTYHKNYKDLDGDSKGEVDNIITSNQDAGMQSHSEKTVEQSKDYLDASKLSTLQHLAVASRTGTFDARNLKNIKAGGDGKTMIQSAAAFSTASLANAIHSGFKGVNVDLKQSDGNHETDVKTILGHILENVKKAGVKVPPAGGHDTHGGGGHDTHGGGGHGNADEIKKAFEKGKKEGKKSGGGGGAH